MNEYANMPPAMAARKYAAANGWTITQVGRRYQATSAGSDDSRIVGMTVERGGYEALFRAMQAADEADRADKSDVPLSTVTIEHKSPDEVLGDLKAGMAMFRAPGETDAELCARREAAIVNDVPMNAEAMTLDTGSFVIAPDTPQRYHASAIAVAGALYPDAKMFMIERSSGMYIPDNPRGHHKRWNRDGDRCNKHGKLVYRHSSFRVRQMGPVVWHVLGMHAHGTPGVAYSLIARQSYAHAVRAVRQIRHWFPAFALHGIVAERVR